MAHDPEASNAVMEAIEASRLEPVETIRDDAAPRSEHAVEAAAEVHIEAVGEQMTATKRARIGDQIVNIQADGRVVRPDDGARARADDDVHRDPVANECAKHADVGGPAQTTRAQHDANSNVFRRR